MRLSISILVVLFLVSPLPAQQLDQRYRSVGEINVTIDGNAYEMIVPFDTEKNKSYASEREILGRRTFNVFGSVVGEDGRPGNPSLQITFFVKNGAPDLVSIEVFDEQGWRRPLTISADAGNGAFSDFRISADNRITANFAGEMLRLDNTDARKPKIDRNAAPVAIKGTFSVAVPAGG